MIIMLIITIVVLITTTITTITTTTTTTTTVTTSSTTYNTTTIYGNNNDKLALCPSFSSRIQNYPNLMQPYDKEYTRMLKYSSFDNKHLYCNHERYSWNLT